MGPCQSHSCHTNYNNHRKLSINTNIIKPHVETKKLIDPSPSHKEKKTEIFNFTKQSLFFPHNYNLFTKEDINFYKNVITIKKHKLDDTIKINSIEDLKYSIEGSNSTDIELKKLTYTWRLFKWITTNIIVTEWEDKENIIKTKRGNTQMIANLFQIIINSLGIDCLIITGEIKNKSGKHYWNAVKLYGQFKLIDCASGCDSYNKYSDYYFCTPYQHLIYSHFPYSNENNFLNQSSVLIDKSHYDKLPDISCYYFLYGFQLMDQKYTKINYCDMKNKKENELSINICIPERIELSFRLKIDDISNFDHDKLIYVETRKFEIYDDHKKLNLLDYYFYYEDIVFNTNLYDNLSDLLCCLKVYNISIRLPYKANYELIILGDLVDNITKDYEYCMSYFINCNNEKFNEINISNAMYPNTSEIFTRNYCEIIKPRLYNLHEYVEKQINIDFIIKIPNCNNAAIFFDDNDEFVLMKKEDNIWNYTLNYDKIVNTIVIAASFDNEELNVLVTYILGY